MVQYGTPPIQVISFLKCNDNVTSYDNQREMFEKGVFDRLSGRGYEEEESTDE